MLLALFPFLPPSTFSFSLCLLLLFSLVFVFSLLAMQRVIQSVQE